MSITSFQFQWYGIQNASAIIYACKIPSLSLVGLRGLGGTRMGHDSI